MRRAYSWLRDYIYVAYWQAASFVFALIGKRLRRLDHGQYAPVVLIPGVYENWQFMRPLAMALHAAGHPVHIVRQLGYNRGSIADMAKVVARFLEDHDLKNVYLVAHSKGGLVAKCALLEPGIAGRVVHIVAINTPFSGSRYAKLFWVRTIRSFSPSDSFLLGLAKNRELNARISSVYAEFDPHIPEGSHLQGARANVKLGVWGHFYLLGSAELHDRVIEILKGFETGA